METIRATISRVVFHSPESGYKVLSARTLSNKIQMLTGEFGPEIIPESIADFHGDYRTHPKYGSQFRVKGYTIVHNAEEITSIQLFLDTIAPNIGIGRSEAIVNYFKMDTIKVLDESPERLQEVPGVGKISANSLTTAWQENRTKWDDERVVYSLRAFLGTIGLKERRIKKVISFFGKGREFEAEQKIREDPYQLINIDGFGFTLVDFIARQLGTPEESPKRLKAYIQYCLNIICPSNGHLFLTIPEIYESAKKYCDDTNSKFLGEDLNTFAIEQAVAGLATEGLIIHEHPRIYSKKCYYFETESATRLVRAMVEKSDLIFLNDHTVEDHIHDFEKENGISLSDEQRKALYYFAEHKVFCLTGAAGTGKTLTLKAIVGLVLKMGLNLTCMTPTGISAKKMASTIQHDAFTIHRILGFRGNEWVYNETNQFITDVVIIDECSMLDQEVMFQLLSALKTRTHMIFVGDHNQLPSVGAGNVLRELITCGHVPTVTLDKIFRQDEASEIIKAAHRILHGDTNLSYFRDDPSSDIFFMRIKEVSEIEKIVTALSEKFKDERRLFQIITPRNTGPLGVDPLNQLLQQALNPPKPHLNEIKCLTFTLRHGDRVIVKKNDYQNEIYNGDIGKVIALTGGIVSIKIDDRVVDLSVDEINEKIKLAYSLTVHRAQGQEYPTVIMLLINQHGKNLLQRNLLYTAVTRAKQKVIVIGHGSAIERAINNTSVILRNTIFGERIKRCLEKTKNRSLSTQLWEPESYPAAIENKEPFSLEPARSFLTDIIEES